MRRGEIVGIDGTNALGKTTYMRILVGVDKPDSGNIEIGARISFKSQYLKQDYDGDVHSLLYVAYHLNAIEGSKIEEQILIPMGIKKLYERNVKNLS